MMYLAQCYMAFCSFVFCIILMMPISAQLAGECAMLCNDLRFEVLTMDMCRYVYMQYMHCCRHHSAIYLSMTLKGSEENPT